MIFLLLWMGIFFLTLCPYSNQNFELGDRLNEKEYRLKVKQEFNGVELAVFIMRSNWIQILRSGRQPLPP